MSVDRSDLELGDGSDATDQTSSCETTPDGVLTVLDSKESKVVDDAREDQLSADDDGSGGTSSKFGNRQDVDDDENCSNHSSSPCPPGSLSHHLGQIRWWTSLDFDQEVYAGRNGTNNEDDGGGETLAGELAELGVDSSLGGSGDTTDQAQEGAESDVIENTHG